MTTTRDIHDYERQKNNTLKAINAAKEISRENKATIIEIYDLLEAERVSDGRIARYLFTLKSIGCMELKHTMKRLDDKDVLQLAKNIAHYKKNTRDEYKKAISLINKVSKKEIPKIPKKKDRRRKIHLFYQKMTIKKGIELNEDKELKALMRFQWDTGCRPHEALNLQVYEVMRDYKGCKVKLKGKTGERIIRVLEHGQELLEHIIGKDPDDYVFDVKYNRYFKTVKRIGRALGIKLTPYLIRHSRINDLSPFMSPAIRCAYFGWLPGSRMSEEYDHMDGEFIEPYIINMIPGQQQPQTAQPYHNPLTQFIPQVQQSIQPHRNHTDRWISAR